MPRDIMRLNAKLFQKYAGLNDFEFCAIYVRQEVYCCKGSPYGQQLGGLETEGVEGVTEVSGSGRGNERL